MYSSYTVIHVATVATYILEISISNYAVSYWSAVTIIGIINKLDFAQPTGKIGQKMVTMLPQLEAKFTLTYMYT